MSQTKKKNRLDPESDYQIKIEKLLHFNPEDCEKQLKHFLICKSLLGHNIKAITVFDTHNSLNNPAPNIPDNF